VGAVGVLRHGFVDAELAHDGAPQCFGLQLLGVLPQSLCVSGLSRPLLPSGLACRAARAAARFSRFFSASRLSGLRIGGFGGQGRLPRAPWAPERPSRGRLPAGAGIAVAGAPGCLRPDAWAIGAFAVKLASRISSVNSRRRCPESRRSACAGQEQRLRDKVDTPSQFRFWPGCGTFSCP
jgi:hypothetical protein